MCIVVNRYIIHISQALHDDLVSIQQPGQTLAGVIQANFDKIYRPIRDDKGKFTSKRSKIIKRGS